MESDKFSMNVVLAALEQADAGFKATGDPPMEHIWVVLFEFTKFFRVIGGFMSTADADVTSKVKIMRTNLAKCKLEPKPKGFLEFVQWEIKEKLHELNGDDGDYSEKRYCSTARTLLRQMWFMTYLLVSTRLLIEDITGKISISASDLFKQAYNEAFGENHGFVLRNAAKLAIMATSNKERFMEACLEGQSVKDKAKDKEKYVEMGRRFIQLLTPSYECLWKFYKENKLTKLP